jgi:hypothetical protein
MIFILALLLSVALCQVKPVWSNAFSASVNVRGWGGHHPHQEHGFFRWFYDSKAGKERFDGPASYKGEFYFTSTYIDVAGKVETWIVYQDSMVECWTNASNALSLPHPNWNNVQFIGKALVDYETCNHWCGDYCNLL